MTILIVASANNWGNQAAPFIIEQAESLRKLGYDVDFFYIKGKGWFSYLRHINMLRNYLRDNRVDLIHAHFVWSALVAVQQKKIPVVVTYHGSDLNEPVLRIVSRFLVYPFAKHSIVVSEKMKYFLPWGKNSVIACGIDTNLFYPNDRHKARQMLGLEMDNKYILFSSRFSRPEKNVNLAREAIAKLKTKVELIAFEGFTREQSALLYSAADLLLLTSQHEGSPQVIKEALACNCPIVSTDVGDVKKVIGPTENCFICSFDAAEIGNRIEYILSKPAKTNGRERLQKLGLSLSDAAQKISNIYSEVLGKSL